MRTILSFDTKSKNQVIPITDKIRDLVKESKVRDGSILIYSLHTTVSLAIQEAIEPCLCEDIFDQLAEIVEDDGRNYKHTCAKHPSGTCKSDGFNGPSHVRQLLTNQNLTLDIENGELVLGRWQDIALFEFDGPRKDRQVRVKIIAD